MLVYSSWPAARVQMRFAAENVLFKMQKPWDHYRANAAGHELDDSLYRTNIRCLILHSDRQRALSCRQLPNKPRISFWIIDRTSDVNEKISNFITLHGGRRNWILCDLLCTFFQPCCDESNTNWKKKKNNDENVHECPSINYENLIWRRAWLNE